MLIPHGSIGSGGRVWTQLIPANTEQSRISRDHLVTTSGRSLLERQAQNDGHHNPAQLVSGQASDGEMLRNDRKRASRGTNQVV